MGINSLFVTLSLVKRGREGFVAQRHDGVRNLLTSFIDKICNNVEIEPRLQALNNERFHLRSAVTSSEERLDIKAGVFWARGTAFFHVRVMHVNSKCYQSKKTLEVFKEQEEEKKRKYQQRVLDVELMGSFTLLVFGTNGGMRNECQLFLKHLADKIAQKDTEPYHIVIT